MKKILLYISFVLFGLIPAQNLSQKRLEKHLSYLGSDIFGGRGTGEVGGNLASKYLALQFDKLNLRPIGDENTFYQYIPMHGSKVQPDSELKLVTGNSEKNLVLNKDYILFNTGDQTFIPNPLPLVFVGYGIFAPEYDYNDYADIDVTGKIVVMLEGEPYSEEAEYFKGEVPTIYSHPEAKQRLAISRGAHGCIIIPFENYNFKEYWNNKKNQYAFEDVDLAYSVSGNLSLILNPATSSSLFRSSGYSFEQVKRMHYSNKIQSFDLKSKISFKGKFTERDFFAPNIIGMYEGNDPDLKDEYIIISAHYDHLGIGPEVKGDNIYNGVFDNAIGTAAVIELANFIVKNKLHPKRSIIFILTTGEEKGLLGSQYYIDHPLRPLYKTIANVNIDGIASFDKFKSIVAPGSEYSTISQFIGRAAEKNELKIAQIPPEFMAWESFNRSDQMAFAKAGIPSVLTLDGPDYENLTYQQGIQMVIDYNKNIYHTPFDDLSNKINYKAALQHINFIKDLVLILANSEETPQWNAGAPFINARLRSFAEKK